MRGGRSANSPPTESPRRISRLKAPPATKAEIGESSKLAVREARETLRLGGEQLVFFYRERTMTTIAGPNGAPIQMEGGPPCRPKPQARSAVSEAGRGGVVLRLV